jgi:hypothetical protein
MLIMGRPKNPEGSGSLTLRLGPLMWGRLDQLASFDVYGKTPTAVALHFISEAVARELRDGGLLRNPPPAPPPSPAPTSS